MTCVPGVWGQSAFIHVGAFSVCVAHFEGIAAVMQVVSVVVCRRISIVPPNRGRRKWDRLPKHRRNRWSGRVDSPWGELVPLLVTAVAFVTGYPVPLEPRLVPPPATWEAAGTFTFECQRTRPTPTPCTKTGFGTATRD